LKSLSELEFSKSKTRFFYRQNESKLLVSHSSDSVLLNSARFENCQICELGGFWISTKLYADRGTIVYSMAISSPGCTTLGQRERKRSNKSVKARFYGGFRAGSYQRGK